MVDLAQEDVSKLKSSNLSVHLLKSKSIKTFPLMNQSGAKFNRAARQLICISYLIMLCNQFSTKSFLSIF